jgi:endonuclease/exonuclease/phosphatase family metal-dependent hydrolase
VCGISVATLNLRNHADRWPERRELVVNQIVAESPELISLQEISMPISQGHWLRRRINARLTGSSRRPYQLVQKRKHHPIHGYFEAVGILSRLPILSHDWIGLGYGGRVAVRANVELPTGLTLDFVAVHLHHRASDRQARQEQVVKLVGWLNNGNRIPWQIVAGDFNETPDGPAIATMKQVYRSAYEDVYGREPLATFPTALVPSPDAWAGCLDYIFLSRAIHTPATVSLFCHRPAGDDDTLYPSDHVGLLARLEL